MAVQEPQPGVFVLVENHEVGTWMSFVGDPEWNHNGPDVTITAYGTDPETVRTAGDRWVTEALRRDRNVTGGSDRLAVRLEIYREVAERTVAHGGAIMCVTHPAVWAEYHRRRA